MTLIRMLRSIAFFSAALTALSTSAQTLTDISRAAELSLDIVWAGQGIEGPCGADWYIVEGRGSGDGWYCIRKSASGWAEVYDWGVIDGGAFPGRLLRPPVPGDRRLLLHSGAQVRSYDPVTRESFPVATLPPFNSIEQPPMRMDRDGSGRNQLMLSAAGNEPLPVIALPGAAAVPWQIVASGTHPLLTQAGRVVPVKLNDTAIDELLVNPFDGLLHVFDAASLLPTGQTFPSAAWTVALNWDGDARDELAFGDNAGAVSLVDPDGGHPARTVFFPDALIRPRHVGMLPRANAATSLLLVVATTQVKVVDPRTGSELGGHALDNPFYFDEGGIRSGDWDLDGTGDAWWVHGRKLLLIQNPATLSTLQEGADWFKWPLAVRQANANGELLALEVFQNEPLFRYEIVRRDADSLAVLGRSSLADPLPAVGNRESVRVGDLNGWALAYQSEFTLTVHDAETGSLRWQRPGPGGASNGQSMVLVDGPCSGASCTNVAVTEVLLGPGQQVSHISLLDGANGGVVWSEVNPLCLGSCQYSAMSYSDLNGDQVPDIIHGGNTSLRAVDGATHQQLWRIDGLPQPIRAVARTGDTRRRLLTIDGVGVLRYHDLATGEPWRQRRYPSDRVCEQTWCRIEYVAVSQNIGYWAVFNGNPAIHWIRDDLRASSVQPNSGADHFLGSGPAEVITGGHFGLVRSSVSMDDLFVDDFEGR
jgi:hypothetical protein